jgi:GNAT superfamily N-acetyltransferase
VSATQTSGNGCSHRAAIVLSMIRLVVRPYEDPDAQRLIRALYVEQLDTYGFADPPDRDVAGDYMEPSGMLLVAYTVEGRPVGCGGYRTYEASEHIAEVRKMYVHPEQRGHGLGRRILNQLEQQAAEHGARTMLLETGVLNVAAIGLYSAAGYLPIPSYVKGRHEANRAFAKTLTSDQVG